MLHFIKISEQFVLRLPFFFLLLSLELLPLERLNLHLLVDTVLILLQLLLLCSLVLLVLPSEMCFQTFLPADSKFIASAPSHLDLVPNRVFCLV